METGVSIHFFKNLRLLFTNHFTRARLKLKSALISTSFAVLSVVSDVSNPVEIKLTLKIVSHVHKKKKKVMTL